MVSDNLKNIFNFKVFFVTYTLLPKHFKIEDIF